jgi:putative inorganic carbon (HCO3(-)) transporter
MNMSSLPISTSTPFTERRLPLISGAAAAVLAALFILAHWSLAVCGAFIILALSATENETFLLAVIFFLPISWLLKTDFIIHDVMTAGRVLVVAGFFLGRLYRGQIGIKGLLRPAFSRWSLLFGAAVLISVIFGTGGWTHFSARSLAILASSIAFYFFILEWTDSRERVNVILSVLLWSTMATAVFAIIQEIAGGYTSFWLMLNPPAPYEELADWSWRATSFLNYPNSLAAYLNLLLPLAVAFYFCGEGAWKRLGRWTAGFGVIGLVCTQSRGGISALGFVLILAILYFVKAWPKKIALFGALAVAVWALYLVGVSVSPERLSEGVGVSSGGRLVLWAVAWDLFRNSQLFGVGIGNFTGMYGPYINLSWIRPDYLTVNNLYLEILSETGLLGLAAFVALIVSGIRGAFRRLVTSTDSMSRSISFGLLGALATVIVHGTVDLTLDVNPQFDTLLWMLLALFAADLALQSKPEGQRLIPGLPEAS